jgi:hypothetical protein
MFAVRDLFEVVRIIAGVYYLLADTKAVSLRDSLSSGPVKGTYPLCRNPCLRRRIGEGVPSVMAAMLRCLGLNHADRRWEL